MGFLSLFVSVCLCVYCHQYIYIHRVFTASWRRRRVLRNTWSHSSGPRGHARNMAPSVGWALLRTWLDSLDVSSYVGARWLPCKFGCAITENSAEVDRLDHDVDCDAWWDNWLATFCKECRWMWAASCWNFLVLCLQFLDPSRSEHHNEPVALTVATYVYHTVNRSSFC